MTFTTYPVAVITDFDDRLIFPEIPHDCLATGVSRGQNVLDLPVPRECLDVFWGLLRKDCREGDNFSPLGPRNTYSYIAPSHPLQAQV